MMEISMNYTAEYHNTSVIYGWVFYAELGTKTIS